VALDPKAQKALYVLVGVAVLAAVPLAMKWSDKRVEDPVTRLLREKQQALATITAAGKKDLACEVVELREAQNGELWTHGCGKRARYVPAKDGTFSLSGSVEADEECVVRWSREADAGDAGGAREAAAKLRGAGKVARVRIPLGAFGVTGLAKLRYGENVEVFLELDAGALGDTLPVPCIDPGADGGVREGPCNKEWSAAAEVAECGR
jgi:hypothetical protein